MGIQQMLLGGQLTNSTVVTTGSPGAGTFGYNNGGYGSVTNVLNLPVSNNSNAVRTVNTQPGMDFFIQTDGSYTLGQNGAFSTVTVLDSSNTLRNFTAASATYSAVTTSWTWGTGLSPVWNASALSRTLSLSF